jgi:hypothetical protein
VPALPDPAVRSLRAELHGTLLTRDAPGYLERCAGWNRLRAHRPDVIVVAADVADVVATVAFAANQGMGLGVQSTGHGMVRPVDDVLLDTSDLTSLAIDADRRTARVGAGCTWGAVLRAAQRHGLAPLLGSSPTVGAVGYTLGGGLGWLARKHGVACDAVRSLDVVTPDARPRRVSRDDDPELFRALRGGGGGAWCVVTAMEIDLVPLSTVYAGNLYYAPEDAGDVVDAYARWVAGMPDDLTSSLVYMNVPPAPEVPEPIRGRSFVIVRGCWSGDLAAGRSALDGWRAQRPPLIDRWDTMPFAECATISNDRAAPAPAVVTAEWLSRFDRGVGEQLAAQTFPAGAPPALVFSEVRHLGGAVASADRSISSFGHRDHPFLLTMVGMAGHHDPAAIREHQSSVRRSLGDAATGATYLNYLDQEDRSTRTADAFEPDDRARLAGLQRRLDPSQLLRYGVNHIG